MNWFFENGFLSRLRRLFIGELNFRLLNCLRVHYFIVIDFSLEEVSKVCLLKLISSGFQPFLQPIWVFNFWQNIVNSLQRCWYGDNFLNRAAEPLNIVIPVKDIPELEIVFLHILLFRPSFEILGLSRLFRLENLGWDCSFRGSGFGGFGRNDVVTTNSLAFHNIFT